MPPTTVTPKSWLELRSFIGETREFWHVYLEMLAATCGADAAGLAVPDGAGNWTLRLVRPSPGPLWQSLDGEALAGHAVAAARTGQAVIPHADGEWVVGLVAGGENLPRAMVLVAVEPGRGEVVAGILAAALATPELLAARREAEDARERRDRLAASTGLVLAVQNQPGFRAAAMALCNEAASRFHADRASFGWVTGNGIEIQAVSDTEKFETNSTVLQRLAAAMEECLDQEEEILWPRPEGQVFVTRDHEAYAKEAGVPRVLSLPMFFPSAGGPEAPQGRPSPANPDRPVGVLTVERAGSEFSVEEMRVLRLALDQLGPGMVAIHGRDRWFGLRWWLGFRSGVARLLGPAHTGWKLAGVAACGLLVASLVVERDFRIEAKCELATDAMALLTAPFDGHIAEAVVRPGDAVKKGDLLVALETRDLELQREAAKADRERHRADALRSEAADDLASMRMAMARAEQAEAQLAAVEERLARARIVAPFDGVVVEGDLRQNIAAPVSKGDNLLRVARIEDFHALAHIDERDIRYVGEGSTGEMLLLARPDLPFPMTVEKLEPVARTEEGGNHFTARIRFNDGPSDWWRPGMTGQAKIHAGRRSVFFLATRRTSDALRLFFW
jgi:RND family efflux transporter MFP subunit